MTTKADRIRWLADLSAERRAMREQGSDARYAIWAQTYVPQPVRHSAYKPNTARVKRPKGSARAAMTARLVVIQEDRCYICIAAGEAEGISRFGDGALRPVLEHVQPISRGGRNERNVAAAHAMCDAIKGSRAPTRNELFALALINDGLPPSRPSQCQARSTARPSAEGGAGAP